MLDENAQQVGILSLKDALALAKSKNLNLLEIAPTANPPVCRLLAYRKIRPGLNGDELGLAE